MPKSRKSRKLSRTSNRKSKFHRKSLRKSQRKFCRRFGSQQLNTEGLGLSIEEIEKMFNESKVQQNKKVKLSSTEELEQLFDKQEEERDHERKHEYYSQWWREGKELDSNRSSRMQDSEINPRPPLVKHMPRFGDPRKAPKKDGSKFHFAP
jgi:hypothetical protein